jgi:hypothetical protein
VLSRLGRVVLVAALVVAVVSGGYYLLRGDGSSAPRAHGTPFKAATAPLGVSVVDEVRGPTVATQRVFWAGDQLDVFGYTGFRETSGVAGESYTPATGEWRAWPAWPYPETLVHPATVWTGTQLVVIGVGCSGLQSDEESLTCSSQDVRAATFDPAVFAWRTVAQPPGSEMLDLTGEDVGLCCRAIGRSGDEAVFQVGARYLAVQPSSGKWSSIAAPPTPAQAVSFCTFAGRLTTILRENATTNGVLSTAKASRAVQLQGDQWVELPAVHAPRGDTPLNDQFESVAITCGPTSLVAIDTFWTIASLYTSGASGWTELPQPNVTLEGSVDSPIPPQATVQLPPTFTAAQWTGDRFVWWLATTTTPLHDPRSGEQVQIVTNGVGVLLDPQTGDWRNVPPGPRNADDPSLMAWHDDVGYAVVLDDTNHPQLVAYKPY